MSDEPLLDEELINMLVEQALMRQFNELREFLIQNKELLAAKVKYL